MRVSVDKWYLDLVTPAGVAWIGYAAKVRVGPVRFGYAGRLMGGAGPRGGVHRTRLRTDLPRQDRGTIWWAPRSLPISGRWDVGGGAPPRVLGDGDPLLSWEVKATRSVAEVTDGDLVLGGLGYLERLTLAGSLDLGIDALHWGRWIADGKSDGPRSVVWIRWVGPRPLRVLLVDGVEVEPGRIDESAVRGAHGELRLEDSVELRSGGLGDTVLASLPSAVRRLARRVGGWEETKWVSRGHLAGTQGAESTGWAIHELVRFGSAR